MENENINGKFFIIVDAGDGWVQEKSDPYFNTKKEAEIYVETSIKNKKIKYDIVFIKSEVE